MFVMSWIKGCLQGRNRPSPERSRIVAIWDDNFTRNFVIKCTILFARLSEWVIIVQRQMTIFFSYVMERTSNILIRWWCSLCTRPTFLIWFFIVLAQWNNSPRVNISLHLDTLFWFRANLSLFLLLDDACLAEK